MKENYPIRQLQEADVSDLSKFGVDIFRATYAHLLVGDFEQENMKVYLSKAFAEKKLLTELQDDYIRYFGLFDNNVLIGYFKLNYEKRQSMPKPDSFLEIERLYLGQDYQRRGLGKYMLEWIEAWAVKQNYTHIWLRSWERNEIAISFYKKHGMKVTGTTEYKFEESNDLDYVFEKRLT